MCNGWRKFVIPEMINVHVGATPRGLATTQQDQQNPKAEPIPAGRIAAAETQNPWVMPWVVR